MVLKPRRARGRHVRRAARGRHVRGPARAADRPPLLYPPGKFWGAVLGGPGTRRTRHTESLLFWGLPALTGLAVSWAASVAEMAEQAAAAGGAVTLALPWWWLAVSG